MTEELQKIEQKIKSLDSVYLNMIYRGQDVLNDLSSITSNEVFEFSQKMLKGMSVLSQAQLEYSCIEAKLKSMLEYFKTQAFLNGADVLEKNKIKDSVTGREKIINSDEFVKEAFLLYSEVNAKISFLKDNFCIYKMAVETARKIIELEKNN